MSETQAHTAAAAEAGGAAPGVPPAAAAGGARTAEAAAAEAGSPPAGLFDLAAEAEAAAAERPAWLPEPFWDPEKKTPRVEALAKAVQDLRARLARAGHAPPDSPEAYRLPEVEGLPKDAVKPDDPLWAAVRKAAHEAGISQAQLEAIARPYLAEAARRAAEARQDEASLREAYQAELARLGPRGRQVLLEVKSWLDGLVGRGVLTAEEKAALYGISTADGVRAMAKLRSLAGEQPIPLDALEDGRMSVADARRLMDEALRTRDAKLGEQATRALRELAAKGMLG